jgi:hypothetical protein
MTIYDFESRMSFDFISMKNTARKRILIKKEFDIFKKMKDIWEFIKKKLVKAQESQKDHADKTRVDSFEYRVDDLVWLSIRNIKTNKSLKKLNHKMIDFYRVLKILKKACQLKLSTSMKIHDTFHISLLRSAFINSLTDQIQSSSFSIIINEKKEYEINDILDNRYHYNKLQYRVSWIEHSLNDAWYSAENFDYAKKIIEDYHVRYSSKSKSALRRDEAHTANAITWINEISTLIEKKLIEARWFLNQAKEMRKTFSSKWIENIKKKNFLSRKEISSIERIAIINTFDRS